MKKSTLTCITALVVAAAVFAAPAFADSHSKYEKYGKEKKGYLEEKFYDKAKFFLSNADEIGLTEGQVKEIKAVKHDTKKTLIKQQAEMDVLAVDIKSMMYTEDIDTAAVAQLIDKKYEIKKEKAKTLVDAIARIKKVPTKGQMDKAREIWKQEEKEEKMAEKGGMMYPGMMMHR